MYAHNAFISIMSVDVFGRNLKRGESSRGPPGIGFKITVDGQYDLENKRLCNLAAPNNLNEAVNLGTLQRTLQVEIERVMDITNRLRNDQNNLDDIMEAHRDEIDIKLQSLESEIKSIKDIILSISHNIHSSNVKV